MPELGPWPELGWSHSRSRLLHECPRQYSMSYMGWQGWSADIDRTAWWVYRLSKTVGLQQLVGMVVHDAARDIVRSVVDGRDLPSWRALFDRGAARIAAVAGQDLSDFLRQPKKHPVFTSRLDGIDPELPDRIRDAQDHLYACILNLLESDLLEQFAGAPSRVLLTDTLDSIPYQLADGTTVPVWAAPDLAFCSADGSLTVLDWKTGGTDGALTQLASYALYALQRYSLPQTTPIIGVVVELNPYIETRYEITGQLLQEASRRIESDVALMRSYQADPIANEPVAYHEFPMRPAQERRRCRWCPFHMICAPGQRDEQTNRPSVPSLPIFAADDDEPVDLLMP